MEQREKKGKGKEEANRGCEMKTWKFLGAYPREDIQHRDKDTA